MTDQAIATLSAEPEHGKDTGSVPWEDMARIVFVALAAAATWFQVWRPWAKADLLAIMATGIGAYPIAKEAISALLARRMTMELSMTIAFGAALAIGEYFTALLIVLFVLIAEVLEHLTAGRGRLAIQNLLELLPQRATVRRHSESLEVDTAELRVGDIVLVRPGSRIPVDGVVLEGHSFVDQSTITGESLPAEKVRGARVYAGAVNQMGALEIRAESVGRDTAFGRIILAVERAERSRAPIQKTADRLAGYLVYVALGCAVVTFLVTRNMRTTISVVIVAGACGIAAGTPLAILGGIGQAARRGLIVKGGLYLEALWSVDTVILDKTGTLTFGTPEVTEIRPSEGVAATELLSFAALAERASEHPLGRAILKKAAEMSIAVGEPEDFQYIPGKGIVCRSDGQEIVVGNRAFFKERGVLNGTPDDVPGEASEILVARSSRCLGGIYITDIPRPEAAHAIRRLRELGLRTILLTGDRREVADAVGKALGVDEVEAESLPEEKLARVRGLMNAGRRVAMIGDGINDVPSLVEANVGIAMGSGTDIARESAPVTLIGNNLANFVEVVLVARRCLGIIMANFVGTLLVDAIGIVLSAFGLLGPVVAAVIHVSSELAFILNSSRLLAPASRRMP